MLKSIALGTCLALTLAACATTPAPSGTTVADNVNKPPPGCVAQTATRLPVKDDECAGFGATYTQKDIQNTGATSADQALRLLDPSVQVSGNGH